MAFFIYGLKRSIPGSFEKNMDLKAPYHGYTMGVWIGWCLYRGGILSHQKSTNDIPMIRCAKTNIFQKEPGNKRFRTGIKIAEDLKGFRSELSKLH